MSYPNGNPECDGGVMHYFASQTTGDDEIVRLCSFHAQERGYGVDEYAGSAAANAPCDESGIPVPLLSSNTLDITISRMIQAQTDGFAPRLKNLANAIVELREYANHGTSTDHPLGNITVAEMIHVCATFKQPFLP